ncbi:MAG: hypothetical protein ACI9WU_004562, partial [Myxococcota bacterium]
AALAGAAEKGLLGSRGLKLWFQALDEGKEKPLASWLVEVYRAHPELAPLACLQAVDASLLDLAVGPCVAAWNGGSTDPIVADHVAGLLAVAADAAEKEGLTEAAFYGGLDARITSGFPGHAEALWSEKEQLKGRWAEGARRIQRAIAGHGDPSRLFVASGGDVPLTTHASPAVRRALATINPISAGHAQGLEGILAGIAGDLAAALPMLSRALVVLTDASDFRTAVVTLRDAAEVGLADLNSGRLDRKTAAEIFLAMELGTPVTALHLRAWPESRLIRGTLVANGKLMGRAAQVATDQLMAEFPDSFWAGAARMTYLGRATPSGSELQTLGRRLLAEHPGDPRAGSIRGMLGEQGMLGDKRKASGAATSKRSPQQLWKVLDHARPTPLAEAQRNALPTVAAEVLGPVGITPSSNHGGMVLRWPEGDALLVALAPAVSPCKGLACLDAALEGAGTYKVLARRPISLPMGEGGEALIAFANDVIWSLAAVPHGRRLYLLSAFVPRSRWDQRAPAIRRLRANARVLDTISDGQRVERLRGMVGLGMEGLGDLSSLVATRKAMDAAKASGVGCPLPRPGPHDNTAAARLRDAWLAEGRAAVRRRLTHCAQPKDSAAAGIAALALLDDDLATYEWGRLAVRRHESRTVEDIKALFLWEHGVQVPRPVHEAGDTRPQFGLLQAIDALSAWGRGQLIQAMMGAAGPRFRSLAMVSAGLTPGAVDSTLVEATIRSGSLVATNTAAQSVAREGIIAAADALRARIKALAASDTDEDWKLLDRLALIMAPLATDADLTAWRALANGTKNKRGKDTLKLDIQVAERIRQVRAGKGGPLDPDRWADRMAAMRLAFEHPRPTGPPTSDALLESAPLPRLVRGHEWTYARIARPDRARSAIVSLFSRLRGKDKRSTQEFRRALLRHVDFHALDAAAEGGALDLTKPMECLEPSTTRWGFLCSVYVADEEKLWAPLAARREGTDSVAALPLRGVSELEKPLFLSSMPFALSGSGEGGGSGGPAPVQLRERYRLESKVGSRRVRTFGIMRLHEDGDVGLDIESYVLINKRLFIHGWRPRPVDVLMDPPTLADSLASRPDIAKLLATPSQGGSLEAIVSQGRLSFPGKGPVRISAMVGTDSIQITAAQKAGTRAKDVDPLLRVLPEGAITVSAFGWGQKEPRLARGTGPPPAFWAATSGSVLAWYGGEGKQVWKQWVVAARSEPGLKRRLAKDNIRVPRGAATVVVAPAGGKAGGWVLGRIGDVLVAASDKALLQRAREVVRSRPTSRRGRRSMVLQVAGERLREQLL